MPNSPSITAQDDLWGMDTCPCCWFENTYGDARCLEGATSPVSDRLWIIPLSEGLASHVSLFLSILGRHLTECADAKKPWLVFLIIGEANLLRSESFKVDMELSFDACHRVANSLKNLAKVDRSLGSNDQRHQRQTEKSVVVGLDRMLPC